MLKLQSFGGENWWKDRIPLETPECRWDENFQMGLEEA
jgi:hypothetical protein